MKYQSPATSPLIDIIDPLIGKATAICEIGCGTGRLVNALAEKYEHLQKIVACDSMNAPSQLHPKIKFKTLDIENSSLDGVFDLIIMNHVFEHIKIPLDYWNH